MRTEEQSKLQATCAVKFTKVWDKWVIGRLWIVFDGFSCSLAIFGVRLSPFTVALQNWAVSAVKARVVEISKISTLTVDASRGSCLAVFREVVILATLCTDWPRTTIFQIGRAHV